MTVAHPTLSLRLERDVRLGRELARGGEGTVYSIVGAPQYVAKMYHRPSPEKTAKLKAMLANPPPDPAREHSHISIAWPVALIENRQGECVGFTMPYIDPQSSFPLLKMYNPRDRRETENNFTWEYLLHMARHLVLIVEALHKKGYVVGDLNESNILVTNTGLATLVDCDSIQVPNPTPKSYFLCTVGKPEYTPPELQGVDFSTVTRTADHDNFALAVLIFLMLMEGRHPFAGVWKGEGVPPALAQNIRDRNFPYRAGNRLSPPRSALPFATLPPRIRGLMRRSFGGRKGNMRPGASEWREALERAEKQLIGCENSPLHVYSKHLNVCPWCERMRDGVTDPFPVVPGTQPGWRYPPKRRIRPAPQPQHSSPPPGQPRSSPGLSRHQTARRPRPLRLLSILILSLSVYWIEGYSWRYYGYGLLHHGVLVAIIGFALLGLLPLLIFLILLWSTSPRSYD